MLQIVFNEISASEISKIPTLEQLELLGEFQVSETTLQNLDGTQYGKLEKDGKTLYRLRAKDYRIYFEILDDKVVVHRVLDKNSLSDFLFRTKLSDEDKALSQSKHFWKLIEEGEHANRQS
ncbi:MAG: hypothetical protein RSE01_06620 [Akkermansia sp.]